MDFRRDIKERILLADGAMATNIIGAGVRIDTIPDILNLENPEPVKRVIKSYFSVGSDIIRTNTFNTIRPKLRNFGLESRLIDLARVGVEICRTVIGNKRYLAVSIGPTGELMLPFGSATFDEIYNYYYEIAKIYESEGVDIFWLETFIDLYELKTAIIAIRDVSKKPIVALMTFDENMRTVFGTTPQIMASVISKLEVDAIGVNCSIGSKWTSNVISEMREFTSVPLVALPNAGKPIINNGMVCYHETPSDMASEVNNLINSGVRVIGACCGSSSEHILAIKDKIDKIKSIPFSNTTYKPKLVLASRGSLVSISPSSFPAIIGERINPTNKKHLIEGLKRGDYTSFINEAREQITAGADVIDVNAGSTVAKEGEVLPSIIRKILEQLDVPISVDTVDDLALQESLKYVSGRALVNSIKDDSSLEFRLRLAKRHGAALVVLTISENGIPKTAKDRIKIAERILERATLCGFKTEDILFDFLTLSAATSLEQMEETLYAIREFKMKGRFTVLGISNISYGLPKRSYVNSAFLSLALYAGLRAAIIDPLDKNVMATLYATSSLLGYDKNFARYISLKVKSTPSDASALESEIPPLLRLSNAIVLGDKDDAVKVTEKLLDKNDPKVLLDEIVKTMKEIGDKFRLNQIYLPQVMLSAEAAQSAFNKIVESAKGEHVEKRGRIVIATVEGDMHDLGKNLVSAVLRNYGFEVIDLGKNVNARKIVESAKEACADIIGLSALMTTTMWKMRDVIELLNDVGLDIPVVVGGAVITDSFAKEIGAYYGKDAIEAVFVIEKLLKKN
ncbi:MAG: homocysteine S-methyltransferase family protein [Deltaproteobacteria bacterium]|nr:homocysteine S-methyltransferase family protein [Deltaproteobacteria bacterium]